MEDQLQGSRLETPLSREEERKARRSSRAIQGMDCALYKRGNEGVERGVQLGGNEGWMGEEGREGGDANADVDAMWMGTRSRGWEVEGEVGG